MSDRAEALLELAERCEKATGPDRELDEDILRVVGRFTESGLPSWQGGLGWPRFTAALDSAMTLVPPDKVWQVHYDPRLSRSFISDQDGFNQIHTLAATPALVLCAASLRALAKEQHHAR